MHILKLTTISVLASSVLFSTQSAQAELVFNNSTGLVAPFRPGTLEVGDEIVLGGSARTLTNFTFQYSGFDFAGTEKMQFRIYENDGALVSGFASPSTVLYDSGIFDIAIEGSQTLIFDDFGLWDGVLPDSFTWSIQFSDLGNNALASIDLFDPITVGSSYNDYWENDGGWILKQGEVPINFNATIEAVPEPSTIALGLIGGMTCLLAYRRQRRR